MRAHRAASLPQVQPPSVLDYTTHTSRGLRCVSESPTARVLNACDEPGKCGKKKENGAVSSGETR
eukprot:2835606-Prymnesium_polylepis.1